MKINCLITISAVLLFTNCKKERECECVTTSTQPGYETTTNIITTSRVKKADLPAECNLSDFEFITGDPDDSYQFYKVRTDCSPK